jgi:hypothetical protein
MQFFKAILLSLSLTSAASASALYNTGEGSLLAISDDTAAPTNSIPFPFDDTDDNVNQLASALDLITSIPDATLDAGPAAMQAWVQQNGNNFIPNLIATGTGDVTRRQTWLAIAKCVAQIGLLIIEDGIPLARLRRIKELIGLLGGATKVAKLLLKAKSWAELYYIAGPYMKDLAEELLGIQGVISACFSF